MSFNSAGTIKELLNNIDYRNDMNFIFVDDGSNDETLQIIKKYCKNHLLNKKNVKINQNGHNLGTVESLRRAINTVDTKYIKFLGADDLINTNILADLCKNYKFDLLLSRVNFIGDGDRISLLKHHNKFMKHFILLPRVLRFITLLSANNLLAVGAVYDTQKLKRIMPKLTGIKLVEDWPIWLYFFSDPSARIIWKNTSFTFYRLSDIQITQSKSILPIINADLSKITDIKLKILSEKKNMMNFRVLMLISRLFNRILLKK